MIYKIRNFIIIVALILVAFLLQTSVINRIPFLDCAPTFLLILAFIYGYSNGKISGMLVGFFSGLLMDVFFSSAIGLHALIFLLIGFFSGIWNKYFYSDNIVIPLLLLIASDLFYCLVYYVYWFVFRSHFIFGYTLIHVIIPEFLMTLIGGMILYLPLRKLNRTLYPEEKELI